MPHDVHTAPIRTCRDFINSQPGNWAIRAIFRQDPSSLHWTPLTWSDFTQWSDLHTDLFAPDDLDDSREAWVEHVRRRFARWSAGEKALALAVLSAVDYAWLADELATYQSASDGTLMSCAFALLDGAHGRFAEAVGACLARVDD